MVVGWARRECCNRTARVSLDSAHPPDSSYTKLVDGVIVVRLLLTERPRRRRWYLTRDAIGTISQAEPRPRRPGSQPSVAAPPPGSQSSDHTARGRSQDHIHGVTHVVTALLSGHTRSHFTPRHRPLHSHLPAPHRTPHQHPPIGDTAGGQSTPQRGLAGFDQRERPPWQTRGRPAGKGGRQGCLLGTGVGRGWRLPDLFSSVCLFMRCPGATQHG